MSTTDWGLVGDIGATYARFALVQPDGKQSNIRAIPCEDYASIGDALSAYLGEIGGGPPTQVVLAVASSPMGDKVSLTNSPWTFSIEELRQRTGMPHLSVVNDLYAHAAAVPPSQQTGPHSGRFRRSSGRCACRHHRARHWPWGRRPRACRFRTSASRGRRRTRHYAAGRCARERRAGPRAPAL